MAGIKLYNILEEKIMKKVYVVQYNTYSDYGVRVFTDEKKATKFFEDKMSLIVDEVGSFYGTDITKVRRDNMQSFNAYVPCEDDTYLGQNYWVELTEEELD